MLMYFVYISEQNLAHKGLNQGNINHSGNYIRAVADVLSPISAILI